MKNLKQFFILYPFVNYYSEKSTNRYNEIFCFKISQMDIISAKKLNAFYPKLFYNVSIYKWIILLIMRR